MTKRVLIVGGAGMLGHKLAHVLAADPDFEVHCTVRELPSVPFRHPRAAYHEAVAIGYGNPRLREVMRDVDPAVVLNAVGAIKQRDLYAAAEETLYLNGTLPHLLALWSRERGARVVHFSTDCVFQGDRGRYMEQDAPDATDLYGLSKARGEVDYGPHLTIRTSIIGFETRGHLSLLSWLLRQPRGATLRGYSHAIFSGLPTVTLSRTVLEILKRDRPLHGLYHVASQPISKFELLGRVSAALGLAHVVEKDASVRIDRSLIDARFREATGTVTPGWDALTAELVKDFVSLPYATVYKALNDRKAPR